MKKIEFLKMNLCNIIETKLDIKKNTFSLISDERRMKIFNDFKKSHFYSENNYTKFCNYILFKNNEIKNKLYNEKN